MRQHLPSTVSSFERSRWAHAYTRRERESERNGIPTAQPAAHAHTNSTESNGDESHESNGDESHESNGDESHESNGDESLRVTEMRAMRVTEMIAESYESNG
jgi:hypothetical protein